MNKIGDSSNFRKGPTWNIICDFYDIKFDKNIETFIQVVRHTYLVENGNFLGQNEITYSEINSSLRKSNINQMTINTLTLTHRSRYIDINNSINYERVSHISASEKYI